MKDEHAKMEAEETPEFEAKSHAPSFLKKAAKLSKAKKGEKKVEVKKAAHKR